MSTKLDANVNLCVTESKVPDICNIRSGCPKLSTYKLIDDCFNWLIPQTDSVRLLKEIS